MTARWLTSLADFAACAESWDAAVGRTHGDNPFLLSPFLLAWTEALIPAASVRVLLLERDGALLAGWPLFLSPRRHAGVSWRALRPLGLGFANLTEPFYSIPEAEFAAAAERGLRALEDWDYCSLPLARDPWWQAMALRHRTRRHGFAARLCAGRPAAELRLRLRPHMQANLRRAERRATEWGALELRRETAPAALNELIEFQLRHNGPARYAPEPEVGAPPAAWEAFVRTLLPRLAACGRLDAMALRLGGELAAVGFGFRYGPGYKSMLTSFDPRFAPAAPGLLLFDRLLDWCQAGPVFAGGCAPAASRWSAPPGRSGIGRVEASVCWLDMYADGGGFDKRRWSPELIPLYWGHIFAPSFRGRLLSLKSSK